MNQLFGLQHRGDRYLSYSSRHTQVPVPLAISSFSYHFESLYSKGVLSARRLKNLLKKDGLGKSISSDI